MISKTSSDAYQAITESGGAMDQRQKVRAALRDRARELRMYDLIGEAAPEVPE